MIKTKSILMLFLFILYGQSFEPSQNLKKTVKNFTKTIADTSSSYLNYSRRLIKYIDPTVNADKITSTYFANYKLNLDTASYLIKITRISIIYNEDKTQAKSMDGK